MPRGGKQPNAGRKRAIADPAARKEIKREYVIRMELRGLAKARARDPIVQAHCGINEKILEKLRIHARSLTEEEALALEPQDIDARYAKIPLQDRMAIAKQRKATIKRAKGVRIAIIKGFKKPTTIKRAKGFGAIVIKELAEEYGFTERAIRRAVDE